MKEKFVSIRLQTSGNGIGQMRHDTRFDKVDYLRNNNKNIYFIDNKKYVFANNESDKVSYVHQILQRKLEGIKTYQQQVYHEATGQTSQLQNHFVSGVITFSEGINEDYSSNPELFESLMQDSIKEVAAYNQMEKVYITLHREEKNIHAHFMLRSFNDEGKNIYRHTYKDRSHGEEMQNIVGDIWSSFGVGYKRGIRKDRRLELAAKKLFNISYDELDQDQKDKVWEKANVKHSSVRESHEIELENLSQHQEELETYIKKLQTHKTKFTTSHLAVKEDYTKLNQNIKSAKKLLRNIKQTVRSNKKEMIAAVKEQAEELLEKNQNIMGVIDKEGLKHDIAKELYEMSGIKVSIFENTELQAKNKKLYDDNVLLATGNKLYDERNSALLEENEYLKYEVKSLKKNIVEKDNTINDLNNDKNELLADIQEMEKAYGFNYQEFKANRQSQFEKMKLEKVQRKNIIRMKGMNL